MKTFFTAVLMLVVIAASVAGALAFTRMQGGGQYGGYSQIQAHPNSHIAEVDKMEMEQKTCFDRFPNPFDRNRNECLKAYGHHSAIGQWFH